jgi:O-antigen/teichoic acid export membrane protein
MPYSAQEQIYIILISAVLIYNSFYGFFGSVFQAAQKMQYNSILGVLDKTLFVSISIFILYLGYGLPELFGVLLFSHFSILIIEYVLIKRFVRFKLVNKIKWNKNLLKSALIFSILGFTTLLTSRIDLVMISWLGSSRDVGIYAVAFQITRVAVGFRGIVSTAFFPIFVKTFHNKLVNFKLLLNYSFLLSIIILLPAAVVSLFSEQFFTLVFGLEYVESSVIFSVLIFHIAFAFFTLPFTNILQATHNEHIIFKISWIGPLINITMNYLLFNEFGLIGIAYATFVTGFVSVPITVLVTWKTIRKHNKIILNKI